MCAIISHDIPSNHGGTPPAAYSTGVGYGRGQVRYTENMSIIGIEFFVAQDYEGPVMYEVWWSRDMSNGGMQDKYKLRSRNQFETATYKSGDKMVLNYDAPSFTTAVMTATSYSIADGSHQDLVSMRAPAAGRYIVVATVRSKTPNTSAYGIATLRNNDVLVANSETETGYGVIMSTSAVLYQTLDLANNDEIVVRPAESGGFLFPTYN